MSPKELLYIEDALGHEKFLISQCQQAAQALTDPVLKDCAMRMKAADAESCSKIHELMPVRIR